MFNIYKTKIYSAVKLERMFKMLEFIEKAVLLSFIALSAYFLCGFLSNIFLKEYSQILLGWLIFLASSFFLIKTFNVFCHAKLKNPALKFGLERTIQSDQLNLAELLNVKSAKALDRTFKLCRKRKIKMPNSTTLLYFVLDHKNPKLNFMFSRIGISQKEFSRRIKKSSAFSKEGEEKELEEIIKDAAKTAFERGGVRIKSGDFIVALSQIEPNLKRFLIENNLDYQDMANLNWWQESLEKKANQTKRFWDYQNLIRNGSLAKDWACGFTPMLDQFSTDWTQIIRYRGFEEIIGHEKNLLQIERILAKEDNNNALIVGEPGTGRKSIIQALAIKSFLSKSLKPVNNKRILELDIVSVVTQSQNEKEAESILTRCLLEAESAGNVILVISDIHNFLGSENRIGTLDISGVIAPFLSSQNCQIIGITSYLGLHKFIEKKKAILDSFDKVEVEEISAHQTLLLLEKKVLALEYKYNKYISYFAIKSVIELSQKYISYIPFPKKALDLLEDVVIYVSTYTNSKVILVDHVAHIVSEKTQIPIGKIGKEEKQTLLNLEELLHKRVIDQKEAIAEVSSALRRARTQVQSRNGPMGAFLFLGPTGVGKTETAKALASAYFGSEERIIRLDMSEFQSIEDISRLIGSYNQEGILTTKIREDPFSLLLLDEIEKAHPNVLNIFLQVLDEGHLTDNIGRKVNFSNTIIIATSNAGYKIVLDALKKHIPLQQVKQKILDFLFEEGMFRPEFINRFDSVVVFRSLTKENLLDIAHLQLTKLKGNLSKKGIEFGITYQLKEKIVELSYNPMFGAREMKRVIQEKIQNPIAQAILSDRIGTGSAIEVNPDDFSIIRK